MGIWLGMIKAFLLLAIACSLLLSKPNLVYCGNTKSSKHMHNDKDISLCIIICLMNSLVPVNCTSRYSMNTVDPNYPLSVWLLLSLYSITLKSNKENDHQVMKLLIVKQILPVSTTWNVRRTVLRMWIPYLGGKGLINTIFWLWLYP